MSVKDVSSKLAIEAAKQASISMRASQGAIIVAFDEDGLFAISSYGHTRKKCDEMRVKADSLAMFLRAGADGFAQSMAAVLESDERSVFEGMIAFLRQARREERRLEAQK